MDRKFLQKVNYTTDREVSVMQSMWKEDNKDPRIIYSPRATKYGIELRLRKDFVVDNAAPGIILRDATELAERCILEALYKDLKPLVYKAMEAVYSSDGLKAMDLLDKMQSIMEHKDFSDDR